MTAFADLTAAIKSSLEQAPAVCDTILRARDRRVPESKQRAINITFVGARPVEGEINGAPIDWQTTVVVECYAKAAADESADVPLDELVGTVFARLAADHTLGGLVDDISAPTIEADFDSLGERTGWAAMKYTVLHRTANNTLEGA